jgi:hypothetical protein
MAEQVPSVGEPEAGGAKVILTCLTSYAASSPEGAALADPITALKETFQFLYESLYWGIPANQLSEPVFWAGKFS